jgi:hypothetical protein
MTTAEKIERAKAVFRRAEAAHAAEFMRVVVPARAQRDSLVRPAQKAFEKLEAKARARREKKDEAAWARYQKRLFTLLNAQIEEQERDPKALKMIRALTGKGYKITRETD